MDEVLSGEVVNPETHIDVTVTLTAEIVRDLHNEPAFHELVGWDVVTRAMRLLNGEE